MESAGRRQIRAPEPNRIGGGIVIEIPDSDLGCLLVGPGKGFPFRRE